jgi:hypothetical protein
LSTYDKDGLSLFASTNLPVSRAQLTLISVFSSYLGINVYIYHICILVWAWWYTSVILALRKLRQEDQEFETSLDYTARTCLKKYTFGC